jgi:hypothetical protein
MRLSEDKIKQAILHPEKDVRGTALTYFSDSHNDDPEAMPLAIRAMERYGRAKAFDFCHYITPLAQTEDTINWVIAELNREFQGDATERYTYFSALSRLLCFTDVRLVVRRPAEVLGAKSFDQKEAQAFRERLLMFTWDAETCWDELATFCEANKDKANLEQFDVGHGIRIVKALAALDHGYEDRIIDILSQPVRDYRHDPRRWLRPLMAELAGEMRLESAIPLLVQNLGHPDDYLASRSLYGLSRIGTKAVVEAVCDLYPGAPAAFRLNASELLQKVPCDPPVERVVAFLHGTRDIQTQITLCDTLLSHFAFEGIEPVRRFLLGRELTPDLRHLRSKLISTCTIMDVQFPEYDPWKREAQEDATEEGQKISEILTLIAESGGDLDRVVRKMQAKLAERNRPDGGGQARAPSIPTGRAPKVGRNDPCPCGSGKKFKNCCMNRRGGG